MLNRSRQYFSITTNKIIFVLLFSFGCGPTNGFYSLKRIDKIVTSIDNSINSLNIEPFIEIEVNQYSGDAIAFYNNEGLKKIELENNYDNQKLNIYFHSKKPIFISLLKNNGYVTTQLLGRKLGDTVSYPVPFSFLDKDSCRVYVKNWNSFDILREIGSCTFQKEEIQSIINSTEEAISNQTSP